MNTTVYINRNDRTSRFAMEELTAYLTRMDPSLELSETSDPDTALIHLSVNGEMPEGAGVDEAIEVHAAGGRADISGNCPRALLLAVYRFLDAAGCRFLRPGAAYEFVPQKEFSRITVDLQEKPSFRHRGVCIEGADSLENIIDFISWLPKVGYNSFFIQFENPYSFLKRWYEHEFNPYMEKEPFSVEAAQKMSDMVDEEISRRGLLHHRVGHGWTGEVLGYSSKYGWESGVELAEENREYAAMLGGKRDLNEKAPILTSLCFSNPKVMEKMTDIVVDYAKARPDVDYLHVWLSDARNNICECEECRKDIPADQYVRLLNLLDEKLERAGLSTRICFLLYHELLFAPEKEHINNPDRFVMMFAPITRTFEKSYADVDYENGVSNPAPYVRNHVVMPNSLEENLSYLFQWQKVYDGDSFVYDYPLGRAHYGDLGYVGISRTIYRDIRYLDRLKLNGYISCQELRSGFPNHFPNYVMGKTLWNQDICYDEIKKDYFDAAYGTGSDTVYCYLDQLSRLSSCDYFNAIGDRINPAMGQRYDAIGNICREFLPQIKSRLMTGSPLQKEFWRALSCHRTYCMIMSRGLGCLCRGQRQMAQDAWEELLHYIRSCEAGFQPYLDVYRVIEVAKNYAGFILEDCPVL